MKRGPTAGIARTIFAAAVLLSSTGDACAASSIEYAVKAAFIYKFASYVEWPAAAFPAQASPLAICAVGDDAVSGLLDQAAAGQRLGTHPIVVRHMQAVTREAGCQIVYIADANPQSVAQDIDGLRGTPALTITDADRTKNVAGTISFIVLDNHVRFNIDEAAATQSGLKISSKLLDLAHTVTPRGAP